MKYKNTEIPEIKKGKVQVWLRGSDRHTGLRLIYPDGKVEYQNGNKNGYFSGGGFKIGCTSSSTQFNAIIACIDYDGSIYPIFLGYI